ncbi:MAG: hypothetical protein FJ104_12365 [Deltaproteobacteria bacterium]|nr:hypothetical protein [Deltaproteobacteria bacterium]
MQARPAPSEPSGTPALGPYDVSPRDLPAPAALPVGTPRILVLGDSVAAKLGMAMRHRQTERRAFVAERGVGDCTILEGEGAAGFTRGASHSCASAWVEDVRTLRPDRTLVVLGGGYYGRLGTGRSRRAPCDPVFDATYEARLLELLRAIAPDAGKLSVARVPYPVGRWRSPGLLERVDCFNRAVERAAVAASASIVRLDLRVCPTPDCVLEEDGAGIRPDGLHFDGVGAEGTARWTLGELLGPGSGTGGGERAAPPASITP